MAGSGASERNRYWALVEALPHGVQECDCSGLITFANAAHARMHGYPEGGTIGLHIWDLETSDAKKRELQEYLEHLVVEQPTPTPYITRKRTRDGGAIDVQVDWNYQRDAAGDLVGFLSVVTDISERVRVERELKTAHDALAQRFSEALRILIAPSPNPILLLELDGVIVATNSALAARFGLTLDEITGRNIYDLLPPELAAQRRSVAEEVQRARAPVFLQDEHGGRSFELCAYPLFDPLGAIERIAVLSVDVSERKEREEEVAAKEAELQQARRMEAIGRLAGGVAHDFNNMLTVVLHYTMLCAYATDSPELRQFLEEIRSTVDRAKGLTGQLLTFGGKRVMEPRVVDLNPVIAGLEDMLHSSVGEEIELRFTAAAEPAWALVDTALIEQVLVNLVINARDAMPRGGELSIDVALCGTADADRVELRVTDTGIGMDEETRKRIFEPFFTTKTNGKGSGLGLSTVFGIVAQSGGEITVESAPDEGTSFRITLPRAEEKSETDASSPPEEPGAEPAPGVILLVEDNNELRRATTLLLEHSGFEVLAADTGMEALRILDEAPRRPDVLVTDVVMPKMHGPELASLARVRQPELHVIYLSGHAEEIVTSGGKVRRDGLFIPKPYDPQELITEIRRLMAT